MTADRVVVATGGRPNYLSESICANGRELCITSDDLFSLPSAPGKSLVIGGGYIAVESAGLLAGLGYPVTLMTRGEFLRSFDRQVVGYLMEGLSNHDVEVKGYHLPYEISRENDGRLLVKYRHTTTGESHQETYDTVMMAVGRQASVE